MRTTLNIEEDALAYAEERSKATGQSLGAVVSEVLREAARPRARGIELSEDGMPHIRARAGKKAVTSAKVQEALEQEDLEKHAATRR